MELDAMIEAAVSTLKHNLRQSCKDFDTPTLRPQLAEQVTEALKEALASAGVAALSAFLEGYETASATLLVDGQMHRFKCASRKTFLTAFGRMTLARNLYQADWGGPCYVPLDAMWGMAGEYATVEVRESVLFASAHITPEETVALLQKCALCAPSATAVKHIIAQTGDVLEEAGETINEAIRNEETVPEDTRVLVASLDGVNVRMDTPGEKRGPCPMRPEKSALGTATCFKQATVGSLSFYGAPPSSDPGAARLCSRYVAQMPEEKTPTLKRRFEDELTHVETQLHERVTKLLLIDGAPGLWRYVEGNARFADYQMLIDFYHTTEHLSLAAERLFGKNTKQAKAFYKRYYTRLLEDDDAPKAIIRAIARYKKGGNLSAIRAKKLEQDRTFFERNQARMTYPDFLRKGLPIGSGPVEAACKTLVKTRLCRSGMYWSWKGGQRILQLRAYVKSDRWDAFWKEYKTMRTKPILHQDLANAA